VLEERADAIVADPDSTVALAAGGLTTADVRRGRGGATHAYAVEQKWSTPEQLELTTEQAAAVTSLTTTGAGVRVLQAGAGSGKTSAVFSRVRQAYETPGRWGTASSAASMLPPVEESTWRH
jgi:hypothetical protein